jgi:hypothetical protein
MGLQPKAVAFHLGKRGLLIPFVETDRSIEIGYVGPYSGAFPIGKQSLSQEAYLGDWSDFLRRSGEKNCFVRLPPASHFSELEELNRRALLGLGFMPDIEELNQSLHLQQPTQSLNRNRRRDLKRAQEQGLVFGEETLKGAHEVISKNRVHKGFPVTMSYQELSKIEEAHPFTILTHSVTLDEVAQAASICFRVNRDLAYVFMWGHDPESLEPGASMTLLASEISRTLAEKGHKLLCLGTSSLEGETNQGLYRFKSSLGAISEQKISYSRSSTSHTTA